ncbi:extensin-like [Lucilia cuprina]|uniref:extensin-like n=1 Tax=Lucilia cuprina TaxID=7375 RepID=UPI001F06A19C|nr:extensin-like [Lucilia cuprina]
MKLFLISFTLLATTWAQSLSSEYLPPTEEYSGAFSNAVETNFLENEPTHSLADDGYRYKTVKRFRLRHRRDVSELSNSYLPPHAASAPAPSFSSAVESAPAPVFSTPVSTETYEVEASEPAPAHSFGDDGYRYKTVKRYRLRRRRDVSELSNSYLPPHAASAPAPSFSSAVETAPAPVYSAPVATESYEVEASEPAPAHSFGDDGYRYKTVKRYRLRRRRDVSELSNSYLPPHAASAPAPVFSSAVETAPAPVYSAPVATESYEVEASEPAPAHSFGDDGYRYKTVKRYRLRRRRDVSELSNSYLPPNAASAPAPAYSTSVETAPASVYSAPAATESYEVQASEPAHSFGEDGYRYKTVKRYRLRRRY